ncbi:hypothetical protein NEDG_01293 [Nematocida displodere]|uniref:Mediator of RNA polymerase II transcription subunit 14 n=1 Tax=Nematocida displodere TaxID=1805483 RepID=A0A177ECV4_9MICR|nr:hypothetical protein NEDG_01293 [Nematocida displodere]
MKVRIPLVSTKDSLILHLPKTALSINECPKTSLSLMIRQKMKFLLNSIYGILTSDTKEQEKRRRIIRLYTNESNELIKMLTLSLSSKYIPKLELLETKTFRLQKYNTDQEQLADELVYKCGELKMQTSSSFDVSRALDVFFRQEVDFPSEALVLAKTFAPAPSTQTAFVRIEQLLRLHIQKSGIWKSQDISFTFDEGRLILRSYGFKSTLFLHASIDEPQWHLVSIEPIEYDAKPISPKVIRGGNMLKELVEATKYVKVLLEIEEIFKTLKEAAEKKTFEISISGTSKEFVVTMLGIIKLEVGINKNWNGPSIFCLFHHQNKTQVFKEEILSHVFSEIDALIQKTYSPHASFTAEKGLFYRGGTFSTLRDLNREITQARVETHTHTPGVIIKEKANVLVQEKVVQTNILIRDASNDYLALAWGEGHFAAPRVFFGKWSGTTPHAQELHVLLPSASAAPRTLSGAVFGLGGISTTHSPKHLIQMLTERPRQMLSLISAYKAIWMVKGIEGMISLDKNIELIVCKALSVTIEGKDNEKNLTEIIGPKINVKDKLCKEEIQRIVWTGVVVLGILSKHMLVLPKRYKQMILSGSINHPKNSTENEMVLLEDKVQLVLAYTKGAIHCTSEHLLVSAWANAALRSTTILGFSQIFELQNVLLMPRLISTVRVNGILGGSLAKTCGIAVVYTVTDTIELRWTGRSQAFGGVFSDIDQLRESSNALVFPLSALSLFLERIGGLFERERVALFGETFRVENEKTVYKFRLAHTTTLECTTLEGGKLADEIKQIIETSPDPEKDLLDRHLFLYPNTS